MGHEFIHYTKRTIITRFPKNPEDKWYAELHKYDSGFDTPVYHITRSTSWPVPEIKKGDIIWLVSQIDSPWGRLPPSLDAKIVVGDIKYLADPKRIKFLADVGSRWFLLRDASEVLEKLRVISKTGEESNPFAVVKNNLGQAFQSIKKLASLSTINEWANIVDNSDFDFISYRIIDGTKEAYEAVSNLMKSNKSIFWDRWSLPRRLAERRELVSDQALDSSLREKILKASTVWGIESPRYAEKISYSAREKELALSINKYQAYSHTL